MGTREGCCVGRLNHMGRTARRVNVLLRHTNAKAFIETHANLNFFWGRVVVNHKVGWRD